MARSIIWHGRLNWYEEQIKLAKSSVSDNKPLQPSTKLPSVKSLLVRSIKRDGLGTFLAYGNGNKGQHRKVLGESTSSGGGLDQQSKAQSGSGSGWKGRLIQHGLGLIHPYTIGFLIYAISAGDLS